MSFSHACAPPMFLFRVAMRAGTAAGTPFGLLPFVLLPCLFFVACDSAQESGGEFPNIAFDVDAMVLAAPETLDQTLVFRRPLSWAPLDSLAFHDARQAAMKDTASGVRLDLLRVFRSHEGAALLVSAISEGLTLERVQEEDFRRSLGNGFRSDDVVRGAFKLHNTDVVQFRILRQDLVVFRLFFPAQARLYQIDYLVPTAEYGALMRAVESSMGSLTSVEQ